jgi:ATP-dependent Clp protease, protease subunit
MTITYEKLARIHARYRPARPLRSILASATPSCEATIYLYEPITPDGVSGISARQFVAALATTSAVRTLHVRINSPGGSVYEAKAIYRQLKEHRARKIVHVDGLAASAASFIAMAGDEIVTAPEATWFIHGAQGIAVGSAADLRACADTLDVETVAIRRIYERRTRQSTADLKAWMNAETFMDAATAKARRFTDSIEGERDVSERVALPIETRIRMAKLGLHRAGC